MKSAFENLSRLLSDYEVRGAQLEMAEIIQKTIDTNRIALIEAGTGTGKSLSYLIPAILSEGRCVISTHTINLQQQLLKKDIPLALDAAERDLQATLVKGMHNYACLRRAEDEQRIASWLRTTRDGSRSDLPFVPDREMWDQVKAESGACNHHKCPHYKRCFFMRARRDLEDAQLLVVNHHLLLTDLAMKAEGESSILPDFDTLIVDEAHHLEDVATKVWASGVSRAELVRLVGQVEIEEKHALVGEINELFFDLAGKFPAEQTRLMEVLDCNATPLVESLGRFATSLRSHEEIELDAIAGKLEQAARNLEVFTTTDPDQDTVRWVETHRTNFQLKSAPLNASQLLQERLFEPIPSVVLTSATLTTGGNFTFLKKRLGLEKPVEAIFESPFSYDKQGLLIVPTDLPPPNHPAFVQKASDTIVEAINASEGNAFVLFTSFRMMHACREIVEERIDFPLLVQGEAHRQELLEQFREKDGSVLFGTDSFWEGVDVAGDALRCVIVAKLPFEVPTEPLVAARSERYSSPFLDYSVPRAIMKLKQGLGRLIRNSSDRGCVICLDSRLVTKPYGNAILQSMPPFPIRREPLAEVGPISRSFFDEEA